MKQPFDGYLRRLLAQGLGLNRIRADLAARGLLVAGDLGARCRQLRDDVEPDPASPVAGPAPEGGNGAGWRPSIWPSGTAVAAVAAAAAATAGASGEAGKAGEVSDPGGQPGPAASWAALSPAQVREVQQAAQREAEREAEREAKREAEREADFVLGYPWLRRAVEVLTIIGTGAQEIVDEIREAGVTKVSVAGIEVYHALFWDRSMTPHEVRTWLAGLPESDCTWHRMAYEVSPLEARAWLGLRCAADPEQAMEQTLTMAMARFRQIMQASAHPGPRSEEPADAAADANLHHEALRWCRLVLQLIRTALTVNEEGRRHSGSSDRRREILLEVQAELQQGEAAARAAVPQAEAEG